MPHHRSGGGKLSFGFAGDLSSRHTVAPDGGSIADYPKGYRFLPANIQMPPGSKTLDGSPADGYWSHDILLDRTHTDPLRPDQRGPNWIPIGLRPEDQHTLKVTSRGLAVVQALKDLHNAEHFTSRGGQLALSKEAQARLIVDQAQYDLIQRPIDEALAKQQAAEEEENRQLLLALKMRLQEVEEANKKPTPGPVVKPEATSYLLLAIAGIVVIAILIFSRRRA